MTLPPVPILVFSHPGPLAKVAALAARLHASAAGPFSLILFTLS